MWMKITLGTLTLSVPVVFLNSPNLSPYFSLNKFERIWLLIFSSWLCLINSHFLITKCHNLYVLYKEKLVVDNWLALKGLSNDGNVNGYGSEKWHFCFGRLFFVRAIGVFFSFLFLNSVSRKRWNVSLWS